MSDDTKQLLEDSIKKASSSVIGEPDWELNSQIWDILNRNPHLGELAVKVLKKRIGGKKIDKSLLALTLLNSIFKNCDGFRRYVSNEFLEWLGNLTRPKKKLFSKGKFEQLSEKEEDRNEEILRLIKAWGKAYKNTKSRDLKQFHRAYIAMVQDGIEFPELGKDDAIFTPKVRVPKDNKPKKHQPQVNFTNQFCKNMYQNCTVLRSMLDEIKSRNELKSNEIIPVLVKNSQDGKKAVVKHINSNPSEALLGQYLEVNILILEVLKYFDGLLDGSIQPGAAKKAAVKEQEKLRKKSKPKKKSKKENEEDVDSKRKNPKPKKKKKKIKNLKMNLYESEPEEDPSSEDEEKSVGAKKEDNNDDVFDFFNQPLKDEKPKKKKKKVDDDEDDFFSQLADDDDMGGNNNNNNNNKKGEELDIFDII